MGYKTKKYCNACKKAFSKDHFESIVYPNGKRYLRCKISIEKRKKNKKRWCFTHKKSFTVDHFITFALKNGKEVLACKESLEKNGGKISKGSRKGIKMPRKKHLEYAVNSFEYLKEISLLKDYGITYKQFCEMMNAQDSKCAICSRDRKFLGKNLHVDHDHNAMRVRGLLCSSCNQGLGNFNENVDNMISAVNYLRESKKII